MIRLPVFAIAAVIFASPAFADTVCRREQDIEQLTKTNGLYKYGEMSLDGDIGEIAYVNNGTRKYFSVKRRGNCFYDAAFLSEEQYEQRFQFEGEGEGDTDSNVVEYAPFTDFPVKSPYSGQSKAPDFAGRDKKFYSYRTRIKKGLEAGPNYAGEFSIIQFGCGTSCSVVFIANNRTGQVFDFPFSGEGFGPTELRYRATSSLLMITRRDGEKCVMESMTFTNDKWKRISTAPLGPADACYDSFDENFARYQKAQNKEVANAGATTDLSDTSKPADARQTEKAASLPSTSSPSGAESGKLKAVYQNYMFVRTCYDLRAGSIPTYINSDQMEKAKQAASVIEKSILATQPKIDKDAVWRDAEAEMKTLLSALNQGAGKFISVIHNDCASIYASMLKFSGATGGPISKDF
ncbi:hypothetical protein NOJ05_18130 [Neorhizobium galegae]|uniref:hypothetical protein n=1 Tax=Neorhizobium galegae TaxID=399 RepID=UPI00210753E2|nr:hypothetical protein [Neorhizobium galegae]MCQ1779126.1 hypothetical protein [Neorhizobium galegae]MCQ1799199.1 hypothetical protein [Neorhizobium galegae]